MKPLLLVLSSALFAIGCSQPKNRLTDDKNIQYQQKQARAQAKNNGNAKQVVIDVQTAEGQIQVPIQAPQGSATPNKDKDSSQQVQTAQEKDEKIEAQDTTASTETDDVKQAPENEKAPVPVAETDESRKQAQEEIAKAVGADTKEQNQESNKSNAPASQNVYLLSLNEAMSIVRQVTQLTQNPKAGEQSIITFNSADSGITLEKINLSTKIQDEVLVIGLLHDKELLEEFKTGDFSFNSPLVTEGKKISMISVCADTQCDIIMFAFRKVIDNKIVFNLPILIKVVDGKMTPAAFKPFEEYSKEVDKINAEKAQSESNKTATEDHTTKADKKNDKELEFVSLSEFNSVLEQLSKTRVVTNDPQLGLITRLLLAPESKIDINKIGLSIVGHQNGVNVHVLDEKQQVIMGMTDIQPKFGEAISTQTAQGFTFNSVCANEKCDVLFVVFSKAEKNKVVVNIPMFIRILEDKRAVILKLKTQKEYQEETRKILKEENNK